MSENPRLLLLETSGRQANVGLALGHEIVQQSELSQARQHARDLVPTIKEMLTQLQWKPTDIEGVIVSLGPGSYTGLRVGIMSAKTFAYAVRCPIIGVETFTVIAHQCSQQGTLHVVSDAQQNRVYHQCFQTTNHGPIPTEELDILPLEELLAKITKDARVSGPGVNVYESQFPSELSLIEPDLRLPKLSSLLSVGLLRLQQAESSDLWSIEPIYLRPSAAEQQWEQRNEQTDSPSKRS